MKRTQIVTHVMPWEIGEYKNTIKVLSESKNFLESGDWISVYATLNLSEGLIDWQNSTLSKELFIEKFKTIKQDCCWANEILFQIVEDGSILGTTAQKREAIKGMYDQFIFLDCDIAFSPTTLKYILEASYAVEGMYFISPETVKLWDPTWDILTHDSFKVKNYGYEKLHDPKLTYNQDIDSVSLKVLPGFKFGCGWFTLYSKSILDYIGIPEWLGAYGPEDTFLMYASQLAVNKGYDIKQYVLEGLYVSENYISRDTTYKDAVKSKDLKNKFRQLAESNFAIELEKFNNTL